MVSLAINSDRLSRFITVGLNLSRREVVDSLLAPLFLDHSPHFLPNRPGPNESSDRDRFLALVDYLSLPEVRLTFSLEHLVESGSDVAYRINGTGTLVRVEIANANDVSQVPNDVSQAVHSRGMERPSFFRDRQTPATSSMIAIEFQGIGIVRFTGDQITEHWGMSQIR